MNNLSPAERQAQLESDGYRSLVCDLCQWGAQGQQYLVAGERKVYVCHACLDELKVQRG